MTIHPITHDAPPFQWIVGINAAPDVFTSSYNIVTGYVEPARITIVNVGNEYILYIDWYEPVIAEAILRELRDQTKEDTWVEIKINEEKNVNGNV